MAPLIGKLVQLIISLQTKMKIDNSSEGARSIKQGSKIDMWCNYSMSSIFMLVTIVYNQRRLYLASAFLAPVAREGLIFLIPHTKHSKCSMLPVVLLHHHDILLDIQRQKSLEYMIIQQYPALYYYHIWLGVGTQLVEHCGFFCSRCVIFDDLLLQKSD